MAQARVATRSGFFVMVVSPKAWVMVTGKPASEFGLLAAGEALLEQAAVRPAVAAAPSRAAKDLRENKGAPFVDDDLSMLRHA